MRLNMKSMGRRTFISLALLTLASGAQAQKKYDTGASDTEIRIGNITPYSGPASSYGIIGKAEAAYFEMINSQGGINGRKIKFISLDDGYNPARTVEQARKLVEQEEVLFIFAPLGTPGNSSIHKYMNMKKVPQLFVSSGAHKWGDHKNFPWTIGWNPSYQIEAQNYVKHLLATKPNAKIAILYQNDDFGKDYHKGIMDGLGDKAKSMIVAQATFETSDAAIDSQILTLKNSGADTFFNIASPKFAALAIRKVGEIGWKPTHYLANVSSSVVSVLKPAGLENSTGLITASYLRDPGDPKWKGTKELAEYMEWNKKYFPGGDPMESGVVTGYSMAQTLVQTLKQAGDNLTRENIMKQAANLEMNLPMLYPGIRLKTGPNDFYPLESSQMLRFNGTGWETVGDIIGER